MLYNGSMQEVSENLLARIIEMVVGALHPEQVYLFGSHAYGRPHRHSDLDLLVVVADDAGDPDALALAGRRALLVCPIPVDILVYHRSEMDKWGPCAMLAATHGGRKGQASICSPKSNWFANGSGGLRLMV